MVNELCQLAASGISARSVILISITLVLCGIIGYVLHKRNKLNVKWLMPVVLLLFTLFSPISNKALAQSASGCVPRQGNSQNPSGIVNASGQLINDNPALAGVFDYNLPYPFPLVGYSARYTIVSNDTAPGGDPFDLTTLRLLGGNSAMDQGQEKFLILDPNDQTLPLNPDALWEYDVDAQHDTNTNVWGWWMLELTCDLVNDNANCDPPLYPNEPPVCANPGNGTCWPSGRVRVSMKSTIAPGTYTVPYTVDTLGGETLNTATITTEVPGTPPESPVIYAQNFPLGDCNAPGLGWNIFPFDMMPYITNHGLGTLLPATIDLDPGTPTLDKSVSLPNPYNTSVITFTVDNSGQLSLNNPDNLSINFYNNLFMFTIQDNNGTISNIGTTFSSNWCG
jgi:hypothetical protein